MSEPILLEGGKLNPALPKSTITEPTLLGAIKSDKKLPTESEAEAIAGEKMLVALAAKYSQFDTNHNGEIENTADYTIGKYGKIQVKNVVDETTPMLKAMFNPDGKNGVNLMEANIAIGELQEVATQTLGKDGIAYDGGSKTPLNITAEIAYEVQSIFGEKQFPKVRLMEALDRIGFKPSPKTPLEAMPINEYVYK